MEQEIADSTLLDTWGSSGLIVKPDISKIIEGWQLGEQPPHEYMNWLQNTFGSKLNHILKNGVAKFEPETEYLSGATVQHNGNVWLCKTTNTNSAPTDANANWKRIITVESLTTVLGGYVALTDFTGANQSLSGSGYQKLPGGLIIQWGIASSSTAGATTNFPITFPNAHIGTSAVAVGGAGASVVISAITSTKSNTTFGSSTGSPSIRYIVVGY